MTTVRECLSKAAEFRRGIKLSSNTSALQSFSSGQIFRRPRGKLSCSRRVR